MRAGHRYEEIDELFGLKMGADDFVRKPFSQRLLVERVKAVLRRSLPKDGSMPKDADMLRFRCEQTYEMGEEYRRPVAGRMNRRSVTMAPQRLHRRSARSTSARVRCQMVRFRRY